MAQKLFSNPFIKHEDWAIGINSLIFIHFVLLYVQVEGYQNILKLRCRPLAFTSYKAFLKTKRKFGTTQSKNITLLNTRKYASVIQSCFLLHLTVGCD